MKITGVRALRHTTLPSRVANEYLRYEIYGEPDAPSSADFSLWIIETDEGPIVFDTGFEEIAASARGQHIDSPVIPSLIEAGYDPARVSKVVLSHLHYDHSGNLEHFVNARVYVQRTEFEFWTGPLSDRKQFVDLKEPSYLRNLSDIQSRGDLVLLEGDTEIAPGVQAILLGGHTVGTQALVVRSEMRTVVLASDAAHFVAELDNDWPFVIVADLPAMYLGFDRLRALRDDGAHVITGHDVATAAAYPSRRLPGGALIIDLLAH